MQALSDPTINPRTSSETKARHLKMKMEYKAFWIGHYFQSLVKTSLLRSGLTNKNFICDAYLVPVIFSKAYVINRVVSPIPSTSGEIPELNE